MNLSLFAPGLVYEEAEGYDAPLVWLVLELRMRKGDHVQVTELQICGPDSGNVATVNISRYLSERYTFIAEAS